MSQPLALTSHLGSRPRSAGLKWGQPLQCKTLSGRYTGHDTVTSGPASTSRASSSVISPPVDSACAPWKR